MGGNAVINGHAAQRIDLNTIDRETLCEDLRDLMFAFDTHFGCILVPSGSTGFLFDDKISDDELMSYKSTFGDIDLQVDVNLKFNLKDIADSTRFKLIGTMKTTNTLVSLWHYRGQVVQIDFEGVEFENGEPTEWSRFAYSASFIDTNFGIKGVAHKYIFRALTAQWTGDYCIAMKTKNKMVMTSLYAFSNRGLRRKLVPIDDGRFIELTTTESSFYTDLESIFRYLISPGTEYTDEIDQAMWSFVGVVGLIKKYIHDDLWECIADGMANLLFGKSAQRIYNSDIEDLMCKQVIMNAMSRALNIEMRRWDALMHSYYGTVQDN